VSATVVRAIRWGGRTVLAATALIAGGYFVHYIYHWQWVRAQIAGVAFIAALILAATSIVVGRLDRLEREVLARLDVLAGGVESRQRSQRGPRVEDAEPQFAWLAAEFAPPRHRGPLPLALIAPSAAITVESPDAGVFIPILLGAGLAVSVVAGLVERTSASLHGATTGTRVTGLVAATVASVLVVGLSVGGIWWLAHYRPAPFVDGRTELTVQVSARSVTPPAEETVEMMGRYCARTAISSVAFEDVRPAGADRAVLVVSPVLDGQAVRRYSGCLQDANLDLHRLTVTATERIPEARP
jgi:hypothetical protein